MAQDRWATFDCYGTLIDWNAGLEAELARLFGADASSSLIERYHRLEPQLQCEDPTRSYREVLALALERLADSAGLALEAGDRDALARSLPGWPPFADVPAALGELRAGGWRLAILSNSDRDLIEASITQLGVPFELAIVAGEIGSYKPAHGHWHEFFSTTNADRRRHVHVGASLFHDISPARELGIRCVWINRLGELADPEPTVELTGLSGLRGVLDGLVPE